MFVREQYTIGGRGFFTHDQARMEAQAPRVGYAKPSRKRERELVRTLEFHNFVVFLWNSY
jgi:hypothetical protein